MAESRQPELRVLEQIRDSLGVETAPARTSTPTQEQARHIQRTYRARFSSPWGPQRLALLSHRSGRPG